MKKLLIALSLTTFVPMTGFAFDSSEAEVSENVCEENARLCSTFSALGKSGNSLRSLLGTNASLSDLDKDAERLMRKSARVFALVGQKSFKRGKLEITRLNREFNNYISDFSADVNNNRTYINKLSSFVGDYNKFAAESLAVIRRGHNSKPIVDNGTYVIKVAHSNLCLDITEASDKNGAKVVQWDCHQKKNQQFYVQRIEGRVYGLVNIGSKKCIDVEGASKKDFANVIQWDCGGKEISDNRKFLIEPLTHGKYLMKALHSGMCLDITRQSKANGAQLIQHGCNGGDHQAFYFNKVN